MARPQMLKLPEVLAELDMSRAAFYRMRARGRPPRPQAAERTGAREP